jgi:hypothetical protein
MSDLALDLSIPACMLFRKISQDLKLAAVCLHEEDLLPQDSILDALSISCSTFYHILNLWETTDDVVKHRFGLPGGPQILHFDDVDYLLHLI